MNLTDEAYASVSVRVTLLALAGQIWSFGGDLVFDLGQNTDPAVPSLRTASSGHLQCGCGTSVNTAHTARLGTSAQCSRGPLAAGSHHPSHAASWASTMGGDRWLAGSQPAHCQVHSAQPAGSGSGRASRLEANFPDAAAHVRQGSGLQLPPLPLHPRDWAGSQRMESCGSDSAC